MGRVPRTYRDDRESAKCISEPSLHPPSRQKTEAQAYDTGDVGQSWMLSLSRKSENAVDRFLASIESGSRSGSGRGNTAQK